jgi:hypothetical protein
MCAIPYLDPDIFFDENGIKSEYMAQGLIKHEYGITVRLYDFENNLIDFDKLDNYTIEWGFHIPTPGEDNANANIMDALSLKDVERIDPDTKKPIPGKYYKHKKSLAIDYKKLNINSLYIIKAVLTWRNDKDAENDTEKSKKEVLTAFFPIPIYRYLKPTEVKDEDTDTTKILFI